MAKKSNKKKRHKSADDPVVKQLIQVLKLAGLKGGKEGFGKALLNMSRSNIDYQLKTHGGFDDMHKDAIVRGLQGEGFKSLGLTEEGVRVIGNWIGRQIPTSRDTITEGDGNNVGSMLLNSNNRNGEDWKSLYLAEKQAREELLIEKIKLESANEALRETIQTLTASN